MSLEDHRNEPRQRSMVEKTSVEDEIDALLELFPEENQPRLLSRLENLNPEEKIAVLQYGLKKRKEIIAAPRYRSDRLHIIGKISDGVFAKALNMDRPTTPVGQGENGRVFEFKNVEQEGGVVVYKMLLREPLNYQNDLLSEGAYQADIAAFAQEQSDLRVGVPKVFYVAATKKGYALAMEKLPGHSIRDITLHNIPLPKDFDYTRLEARLKEFVARLNAEGFYHRDLREGNIMIDPSPKGDEPLAYIIDFGLATKAHSEAEAYRTVDGLRDHGIISTVIQQLKEQQARLPGESS